MRVLLVGSPCRTAKEVGSEFSDDAARKLAMYTLLFSSDDNKPKARAGPGLVLVGARLVGDAATTARVYVRGCSEDQRAAVEKVSRILRPNATNSEVNSNFIS
jgi:hypothetical protein